MGKKFKLGFKGKSKRNNLEPLQGISSSVPAVNEDTIKETERNNANVGAVLVKQVHHPNRTILPHLDHTPSQTPVSTVPDSSKDEKRENPISEVGSTDKYRAKNNAMNSNGGIEFSVATSKQLDDSVFTFSPKVSKASKKIAKTLGSDFMTRQQQHLDRQKKIVSCVLSIRINTLFYYRFICAGFLLFFFFSSSWGAFTNDVNQEGGVVRKVNEFIFHL